MKKRLFVILILVVLLHVACSSKPKITGKWSVDNWDCESVSFTADQKYIKNIGELDNPEQIDRGVISYFEGDNQDCILIQSEVLYDGSWALNQSFSYEIVSENQINLYTDKDYRNDNCLDMKSDTDHEQIILTRE